MQEEQTLSKKERKALNKLAGQKHDSGPKKLLWPMITIVGFLLAGYFIFNSMIPIPADEKDKPLDKPTATDWMKGSSAAPVVIVEYSDLQCPACRAYQPLVKQMTEEYGDRIALIYRHFPLKQIHLQATLAAQAAEAAGMQGKFWEMHDLLFEKQTEWAENPRARALMSDYAKALNLDVSQFKKDLFSKQVKILVNADYMSGLTHGVNATPTFYLNGQKIKNPQSPEEFRSLIDASIGSPSATPSE
jgi:protein-disulfide isomerase